MIARRVLPVVCGLALAGALSGCSRSVTVTAGSATPFTPGLTTAAPTPSAVKSASPTASAATPSATPASPTASAAPSSPSSAAATPSPEASKPAGGLVTLTETGGGGFTLGQPGHASNATEWDAGCKAWVTKGSTGHDVVAMAPDEKSPVNRIVVTAPGGGMATGVVIGMPLSDVTKQDPQARARAGAAHPAWESRMGAATVVYTSFDQQRVGAIEVLAPGATPQALTPGVCG